MRWIKCVIGSLTLFTLIGPGCGSVSRQITSTVHLPEDSLIANFQYRFPPEDITFHRYITKRKLLTRFHIFNSADSLSNFNENEGVHFVLSLLDACNARFRSNDRMILPPGNATPVLDARLELIPVGTIFPDERSVNYYYGEDCYYIKKGSRSNRFSTNILTKYGVRQDSILNVVIMPYDPIELREGRQKVETSGVALGNVIKLAGIFETGRPAWEYAGLLNHEIGHVLTLRHTWNSRDGCDDTPQNGNCWNSREDQICSNNLMDYNAHQSAITPCQIEKMHKALSLPGRRQRKMLLKDWCEKDDGEWQITQDEFWNVPREMRQDVVVGKDAVLHINTWISFPPNGKLEIESGGTLVLTGATLYQDCGRSWQGIIAHKNAKILADTYSQIHDAREDLVYLK